MNAFNFTLCWVHLLLLSFDVIIARSIVSFRHDDVTAANVQFDDGKYQSELQDAIDVLGDVRRASSITLTAMCKTFRTEKGMSSHGNKVAVLTSHLSPTPVINSGDEESQLTWVLRVSGEYGTEVGQMALTAQKRECHLYWQQNRECPLSLDTLFCQLKDLRYNINDFHLAVREVMDARGFKSPTWPSVTPMPDHDVIDVDRQCQRNRKLFSTMSSNWIKMVDILENLK